jgi:hypothetical protein
MVAARQAQQRVAASNRPTTLSQHQQRSYAPFIKESYMSSFNPFNAPRKKLISDFTIGQGVRLVDAGGMSAKVGATGVVVGKDHTYNWLSIKWEKNELSGTQVDGMYSPVHFEDLPNGEYILILKTAAGKYEPAANPRTYATEAQAIAVGDSMASKHGGTFVVFKSVAAVIPPKTVKNTVQKYG